MYISGPGGSGKSRAIDALKDFLEAREEKRRFKHSSYTGVAARNISGMTLRAALGLRQKGESQKMGKALRDIMTIWEGVDHLFINEISRVGCARLAVGGINVIFAGTFHSYNLLNRPDSMHK
jgi:hypothetical protein